MKPISPMNFASQFLSRLLLLACAIPITIMADELKVAVAQPLVTPGDIQGNITRMEPMLAEAVKHGSDLVVFSECGITGYDYKGVSASSAIPQNDPALDKVSDLAKKYQIAVIAGFHEKDGNNLRNSAMVFYPDGKRTLQRKHRIQDPEMGIAPVTPGPRERVLFNLKGFTCAVLICSDDIIDHTGDVSALIPMHLIFESLRPQFATGIVTRKIK
jgi:apolipoprotein N-acyltransferase